MRSVGTALVKLIATATSGLVSFTTNVIRPVKVTCEFSPVQEGTGDPSPTNVRPISGWTGCEITHTGGNLLSPDDTGYGNCTIGPTGNHTTGGYARLSSGFIPVSKGDVLTLGTWITLYKNVGFGFAGIAIYDKDKQFVRRESKNHTLSITATIGEGEKYIRAFSQFEPESESAILTPSVWSRYKIQLERASSITTYESYTGSTLSITFTDPSTGDPMTIYGGTVTLNENGSVDLVSDVRFRTLAGTESWATEAETGTYNMKFKLNLSDMKYGSNMDGIASYIKARDTQAEGYKAGSLCCQFGWNDHRIFVLNATKDIADVSDLATWKAYLADHPLEIVYPLTTPTTYHFDSIGQLQSFLGTNNIWHDMNGDITVEYWNKQ